MQEGAAGGRNRSSMGGARARRGARRVRRRAWIIAVAGCALVAFLYYRPVKAYFHARDTLAQRSQEVRHLQAEKRRLQRRLALDESGATLVRDARRLGLVRPDERLFIVKGIEAWRRARAAAQDASR
jgi:cell division protein FtsB